MDATCPAQAQIRQPLACGRPWQHQLPSGPSAAPGGESSLRAIHLQPIRRRAPGKATGLPGFDAGRRMAGRRLTARRRQLTYLPLPLRHCTRNANCERVILTHGQFTVQCKDTRMRKEYQILVVALF